MSNFRTLLAIIVLLGIINTMQAFADNHVSKYMSYINSSYLGLELDEVKAEYQKNERGDKVDFGLLLFRRALVGGSDAEVKEAFDYWTALYEEGSYKNPMTLAYTGTLESMYAGAAEKMGGIKKIRVVKSGAKKLFKAQKELANSNDSLAYGYVLFLTGNTFSNLPTFFKEFKKQTIPNLNNAGKEYKKAFKSLDAEFAPLEYSLYANVYEAYGRWYEKSEKPSQANAYYKKSKKYAMQYTSIMKKMMEETMDKQEQ